MVVSARTDVDMKLGKPRKAPKVAKYDMDKNFMQEYSKNDKRSKFKKGSGPQWPMSKKKLSK